MSTPRPASPDGFTLRSVAFFGRTMAEYLEMLALDPDQLRDLSILDVASGPGSFVAEAPAAGLDVTGCDPLYGCDPDTITAQGRAESTHAVSKSGAIPARSSTKTSRPSTGRNTPPSTGSRLITGKDGCTAKDHSCNHVLVARRHEKAGFRRTDHANA